MVDLVKTLQRIATDTEEKNNIFREQNRHLVEQGRLFRFNVYHGLSEVGLEEYEAVDRIAEYTQHYLGQFDTMRDLELCVKAMNSGGQRLNIMGQKG